MKVEKINIAELITISTTNSTKLTKNIVNKNDLDNMSKAVSGEKNGMYGKHHTEESKLKMSLNSKGKTAGEKNGMYGKSGMNAINGKHVLMYDLEHNLETDFPSKTAALQYINMK